MNRHRICVFLIPLLALVLPLIGAAQSLPLEGDPLIPGSSAYAEDIPRPEEVIGHAVGARHTTPASIADYFRAVAVASDRVVVREHARSYEGRPLIHAVVTAPGHQQQLEDVRRANLRLSEEPASVSEDDLARQPAVVYMGYSVHGDEASGSEAAMLLLYHLAAGTGPDVAQTLEETVTLIDPMFNPDGRDRFVDWVNRYRGRVATTDPQDMEHNQEWPGGRTNHYWFDLNRDWLPLQHPESRGRVALFHAWRPQVLTDFHEMGSDATYFFQPGIPSRTNPITADENQRLTAEIAEYHAAAMDEMGALYYTRESYDDFYYGKGSTYPDINGSVGILFEQSSSRALERETDGGLLPYAETVRNQTATSLSTLAAVRDMREMLMRHQRDFYAGASDWAAQDEVTGYVVDLSQRRSRAQELAQVLQQHRIRLHRLDRSLTVGDRVYQPGRAYVVPLDQPQARLVKAAMERRTQFPDSLFYDVSAWTLPLAFGVDYDELRQPLEGYLGPTLQNVELNGGRVVGGRARYAYVMPWSRYYAPRALYQLQEAGVQARVMHDPFTAAVEDGEQQFERGSIVVPVSQAELDADDLYTLVQRVAVDNHVQIYAVRTGLTPEGPDFGTGSASVLDRPRVALLVGRGTRAYNAGEAWHLLNERFGIPVSLLDVQHLNGRDLSRYNTIIMAGGSYGGVDADRLREWVEQGGRLLAHGSAVRWAVDNELLSLSQREGVSSDSLFRDLPYDQLQRAYGAQYVGGAIFETELDVTHPLAYGHERRVPVFLRGTNYYDPSEKPGESVGVYTNSPLLSGYISSQNNEVLAGSAALQAVDRGRGSVILYQFNPNFRAFWYGTNGLFLNGVFFGNTF